MLIQISSQDTLRYTPDADAILSLIQISDSDTVRIHSRYGSHSITHSDYSYRHSLDTLQDTDAILLLIQIRSPDIVKIRSRRGYHSDTHSFDLQPTVQQTFLDGIYNPISNKILSPLQMASLSPFPQL
ncbi:unnamed protein product [Vicia faba]|uniref:Uncharacterized protein n=1 Tax=Vicia faba TaxID=3906 RepID=A0AAV1AGZ9_VICFA|nr:unnamed protein product [Vicia faba]